MNPILSRAAESGMQKSVGFFLTRWDSELWMEKVSVKIRHVFLLPYHISE